MLDLGLRQIDPPHRRHVAEAPPEPVLLGDHADRNRQARRRIAASIPRGRGHAGRRRPPSASISGSLRRTRPQARRAGRSAGDAAMARTIVFTRTKRGADQVAQHLDAAGIDAVAIHGNKSQSQRERSLEASSAGQRARPGRNRYRRARHRRRRCHPCRQFRSARVAEAYVHRIGRTARAGAAGVAISLLRRRRARPAAQHREADASRPVRRKTAGPRQARPRRDPLCASRRPADIIKTARSRNAISRSGVLAAPCARMGSADAAPLRRRRRRGAIAPPAGRRAKGRAATPPSDRLWRMGRARPRRACHAPRPVLYA